MSYLNRLNKQIIGDDVILTGESAIDKLPIKLTVKVNDLTDYNNGKLAQYAFPYLTRNERELIISGLTTVEWNKLFGK